METQDKLIQDLLNHLIDKGPTYASNYKRDNHISQCEWGQLIAAAVGNDLIIDMNDTRVGSFKIRPKGRMLAGDGYLQLKQNERAVYERQRLKEENKERKDAEKLDSDLVNSVRQRKAFWFTVAISIMASLCIIVNTILKFFGK